MVSETPITAPPVEGNHVSYKPRYIDIGINLADPIFRGRYYGKERHPDDLSAVVSRAQEVGCSKLIVTGSDFTSSRHALELAKEYPGTVYTTAGIHPCSSAIFSSAHAHEGTDGHTMPCDPDPTQPVPEDHEPDQEKTEKVISDLGKLIDDARSASPNALVAFGEFGLDYDRLHYCSKKVQLHSFAAQLDLVLSLTPQLPLFLHSRAAHEDFVSLLKAKFGAKLERLEKGGVVHSFTGTVEEMQELMDLGLYIGTNGCSFKTAENCEVVKGIHLDRLMLETDGPWCEVRPTHEGWKYLVEKNGTSTESPCEMASGATTPAASGTSTPDAATKPAQKTKKPQKKETGVPERWPAVKKEKWREGAMIKGRNEPCMIERVGKVVAGIKGVEVEEVCEAAWRNTTKIFGLDD
ncbi:deoxyribonuclease tatD [Pseudomassariella vexata]|uniref:Deoxyribonuclease tatD n=1 Tax=Pseudomassariella vexata TaxID=1141098 RepID=A0A1Y2D9Y9_9PEZI|nr:deoxyribonuclease tatD [Pseudomassariella vexata]ORY56082.1 deoxyribonuclease tatD [Pseudomassariella vexata]